MKKIKNNIVLSVPGGLAGQIFSLGYAIWVAKEKNLKVHIQFHDVGTNISKFIISDLFETETCKLFDITFHVTKDTWPPKNLDTSKVIDFRHRLLKRAVENDHLPFGVISKKTLNKLYPGSTIAGYPTNYQIIEDSWKLFSKVISESSRSNFTTSTGLEDSISVHWRLGDYVGNEFHGAVPWISIQTCIEDQISREIPIKIFTDNLGLAQSVLDASNFKQKYEIISNEIWEDLFEMTRSKYFIGTHSGVSFLAALAIRSNNQFAQTYLPDAWFLNEEANLSFQPTRLTFKGSVKYQSNLTINTFPL